MLERGFVLLSAVPSEDARLQGISSSSERSAVFGNVSDSQSFLVPDPLHQQFAFLSGQVSAIR